MEGEGLSAFVPLTQGSIVCRLAIHSFLKSPKTQMGTKNSSHVTCKFVISFVIVVYA